MARGKKQIEGQMVFNFCMDTTNYVVQSNALVGGKQALKLNSAKLIRSAIMQVVKEDEELKPYIITIHDLSELLHIPSSNIYRDIDEITNDIRMGNCDRTAGGDLLLEFRHHRAI